MRLFLLALCALVALASAAPAQIVAVHFKDAKAAKKYKNHLVEYKGEMVVIGEPKVGIKYLEEKNTIQYDPQSTNQLFVVDPKKPEAFAYFMVDGKKEEASRKNRLNISGSHIRKVSMVMRDETLPGLTREYLIRTRQIDDYRAQRDGLDKTSAAWMASHHRLVTSMERLREWLKNVGFPGVIKKLDKVIKKEKKQVREGAIKARAQKAEESVELCDPPENLVAMAEELGGKHEFRGAKSQHLRLYYLVKGGSSEADYISDSQAKDLLKLGEQVIEGFRAEFVDPYIEEGYKDHIPDGALHTFVFLPDDVPSWKRYTNEVFGVTWSGDRGEERLKLPGTGAAGGMPRHQRNLWKVGDRDEEGIICHGLGHSLASRHYGQGRVNLNLPWLTEACAYHAAYEILGRNTVTCLGLREKPTYLKREVPKPGEKTIGVGRRAVYNELALAQGSNIDQIALKKLYELADADLAKSWSFYDYIARKEGKEGQEWLRAAGQHSGARSSFIKNWRAAAAEILGVNPGNAFRTLEERWRKYAETDQLKAGD